MKRYNKIYDKMWYYYHILEAYKQAKKGKTQYKEVQEIEKDPDFYLNEIMNLLITETYTVSNYTEKLINDKGKQRLIKKLPFFPDRIIQWAIMIQLEPIFMEVFTSFTCASVKGRGILKASKLVDRYLKDKVGTTYCLKIDIKKFYDNINHDILKSLLRIKLKDKQLLKLLDTIIDSTDGLPIGSYLSQYLANFYLAYFDHWLKEDLRLKYVVRYMDDIIILHNSKEHLHKVRIQIEDYLHTKLKLELKDNWRVFPTVTGIDFVGYVHYPNKKLLRKHIYRSYIKAQRQYNIKALHSYEGWKKHCYYAKTNQ